MDIAFSSMPSWIGSLVQEADGDLRGLETWSVLHIHVDKP